MVMPEFPSAKISNQARHQESAHMVLQVIYTLSYIVLQVVPKVLPRTQTMISTVDNVPEYRVTAYNIPGTLPEPFFEVYKAPGPEAMTPPINPDRRSLTNLLKFVVSYPQS